MLIGVAGVLYSWICCQNAKQKRLEEFILFLQKSVFAMETEKVRVIEFFSNYRCSDEVIEDTLQEMACRLSQNIYPKGQSVWEEVLKEKEQNWKFDKETFGLIVGAGNGFFGRNRNENICFLQKSMKELETQKNNIKIKDAQERKVWLPVGMLGGIMLTILLI